jgi:hypothetical protein
MNYLLAPLIGAFPPVAFPYRTIFTDANVPLYQFEGATVQIGVSSKEDGLGRSGDIASRNKDSVAVFRRRLGLKLLHSFTPQAEP